MASPEEQGRLFQASRGPSPRPTPSSGKCNSSFFSKREGKARQSRREKGRKRGSNSPFSPLLFSFRRYNGLLLLPPEMKEHRTAFQGKEFKRFVEGRITW
jgi:hypothetical protein